MPLPPLLPGPWRKLIMLEIFTPPAFQSWAYKGLITWVFPSFNFENDEDTSYYRIHVPCWRRKAGLSLSDWTSGPHTWILESLGLRQGRTEEINGKIHRRHGDIPNCQFLKPLKPLSGHSWTVYLPGKAEARGSMTLRKELTVLHAWGLQRQEDLSPNTSSFTD